ncbi:UNVERIFIED_CONTAM: hypothetical protein PYX00_001373 [Menopon gallinae]|uniref:Uncharacterized protein n=1 Tax=Menopon gallinae TaxID=328185 RepID=A0AAW2ICK6_9NEOP
MRHDGGLKTSATTNEKTPDFEKSEKNGNWQDNPVNENDTDCAVQCLYYTIECCECTIL